MVFQIEAEENFKIVKDNWDLVFAIENVEDFKEIIIVKGN